MSSDMKDARWGWAYDYAANLDASYGDFTYEEWEAILGEAHETLKHAPESVVLFWANEFRGGQ